MLRWALPATLAAAAVIALALAVRSKPPVPALTEGGPTPRQQVLEDGTLVELNRHTHIAVAFSAAERRVRLTRGEALFSVAHNPARTFVVEAAGVTVRAVGTAFNVRIGPAGVEVLVTAGCVQLERPAAPLEEVPLLTAGHRVTIPFAGPPPAATAVSREEIDCTLIWQPRLLEFVSTPLAEVAAEFNQRNLVQLIIADEALRALPIGASFRSDNLDGFVRLLEASFGVVAERGPGTITLRRAR
ncbi:MAG: hypothetical protein FJ399_14285 [Verrucomicrobia bacterium]|nr:hypothetical protein [Verrucomicrobiota bacterium]